MKHVAWMLAAAVLIVAAPEWTAAGTISHSGTIVAIDRQAGTILFEEIGPWRVEDGSAPATRQTIVVIASTSFVLARRVPGRGPGGWRGEFVEEPVAPWTIKAGDFATILCLHDRGFLTALEIVVAADDDR